MQALHFDSSSGKMLLRVYLWLALGMGTVGLSGCGSGSRTPGSSGFDPSPPPPEAPPGDSVSDGRYVGTVTIDGEDYFADAIFAAHGETHIYIGGPYDDVGII